MASSENITNTKNRLPRIKISGVAKIIFVALAIGLGTIVVCGFLKQLPSSNGVVGSGSMFTLNDDVRDAFSQLQSAAAYATFCFIAGSIGAYIRSLIGRIEIVEEGLEQTVGFADDILASRALIGGFFGVVVYFAITTGFLSVVLFGFEQTTNVKLEIKLTGYLFFAGMAGLLSSEFFSTIHSQVLKKIRSATDGAKK